MKTTIKNVSKVFVFEDEREFCVTIKDFKDGFVEINMPFYILFDEDDKAVTSFDNRYVIFISGSFAKNSNFKETIFRAFGCTHDTEFLGFKLVNGEVSCVITKEKSSVFDVEETIKNFVKEITAKIIESELEDEKEYCSKVDKINELLFSLDIDFKSDRAEEEYAYKREEKDDDDVKYSQNFIALSQHFMKNGKSAYEAVGEAYNMLDSIEEIVENDLDAIRFIYSYCVHGEEIYNAYVEMLTQEFSKNLEDF